MKAYLFVLGLTFVIFSLLRLQSLLNLDRARYRVTRHIQLTDEDFMIELAPLGRRIAPHRGHRREYVNSREMREYCARILPPAPPKRIVTACLQSPRSAHLTKTRIGANI